MGVLKRIFEPKPKMIYVPGVMDGFLNYLLEADPSLPRPDAVSGANDGEWITEEEARRREVARQNMPSLEELLKDPDVAAVVAAADGLIPAE